MAVYITPKDLEKLNATAEQAKSTIDAYRSQGLSDDEIQNKVNQKTGRVIAYDQAKLDQLRSEKLSRVDKQKAMASEEEDLKTSGWAKIAAIGGNALKMVTFGLSNRLGGEDYRNILNEVSEANPFSAAAGSVVGSIISPVGQGLSSGASALTKGSGVIKQIAGRAAANVIEDQLINVIAKDDNDMSEVLGGSLVGSAFGETIGAGAKFLGRMFSKGGKAKQFVDLAKEAGRSPKEINQVLEEVKRTGDTSKLINAMMDMQSTSGQRVAKMIATGSGTPDELTRITKAGENLSQEVARKKALSGATSFADETKKDWNKYLKIRQGVQEISDEARVARTGDEMQKHVDDLVGDLKAKEDFAYDVGVKEADQALTPNDYYGFTNSSNVSRQDFGEALKRMPDQDLGVDFNTLSRQTDAYKNAMDSVRYPTPELENSILNSDAVKSATNNLQREIKEGILSGKVPLNATQLNSMRMNLLDEASKTGDAKARVLANQIGDLIGSKSEVYKRGINASRMRHQVDEMYQEGANLAKNKGKDILKITDEAGNKVPVENISAPGVSEYTRQATQSGFYRQLSDYAKDGDYEAINLALTSPSVKNIMGEKYLERARKSLGKEVEIMKNWKDLSGVKPKELQAGVVDTMVQAWRFMQFGFRSMGAAGFLNSLLGKDFIDGFSPRAKQLFIKAIDPEQTSDLAINNIRNLLKKAKEFDSVEQRYIVQGIQRAVQKATEQGIVQNEQ